MKQRNLSGIYFRSKGLDGKMENVVFEDLTNAEQHRVLEGRDIDWVKKLAIQLGRTIREIGDQFDLVKS